MEIICFGFSQLSLNIWLPPIRDELDMTTALYDMRYNVLFCKFIFQYSPPDINIFDGYHKILNSEFLLKIVRQLMCQATMCTYVSCLKLCIFQIDYFNNKLLLWWQFFLNKINIHILPPYNYNALHKYWYKSCNVFIKDCFTVE